MRQRDSEVLGGLFRWARALKAGAVMNVEEKRHFEQICAPLPRLLSAGMIHRVRRRSDADETAFARACHCNSSHVRDWEQGRGHPRGPELKLIHLARKRGLAAVS